MKPAMPPRSQNAPQPSATVRVPSLGASLTLVLCSALAAGCGPSNAWDQEFSCAGQERSTTSYADDGPGQPIDKGYPITLDFHLRAQTALVRAHRARAETDADGIVHVAARTPTSWITGTFDPRAAELVLVEEQTLVVAGRAQQVRIAGRYRCQRA